MEYKLCDWTCHRIEALTADQRLALAQRIAGNLMQNRVLLGRFLLVIKRTESYENCGASSVIHDASLQLGLEERESREVLLVAQRLESLPALTERRGI